MSFTFHCTAGNETVVIIAVCSVILFILTGAAAVVAAVLVGLGVRRRGKGQTAGDSAVHYYSTPGPGIAAAEGAGEGRKKESAAIEYYEDMGQGGGGEGRKKESAATDYYEDMGQGGGGEGRKKETTEYYEDVVGGVGEVLANPVTAYEELQQSALPYEHVYSTCKRDGLLDGVEHLAGGASGPDNQPTQRVPRREQHYTALNMNTVNKSEYESLHKMT